MTALWRILSNSSNLMMKSDKERERKEPSSDIKTDADKEREIFVQMCILIGLACVLCAGMIFYQLFWDTPIIIYNNSQIQTQSEESAVALPSSAPQEKIDLNTATAEELESLPGIGEVKAQSIVEYREQYGPFTSIEEIKNVKGIGEKTFEAIQDLIIVKQETS